MRLPRLMLRLVFALPVAGVALSAALLGRGELSAWGWAWVAVVLGAGGVVMAPRQRRRLWLVPTLALVVLVGARLALPEREGAVLATLDAQGGLHPARFVDRLFEERDAAVVGSRLLAGVHLVRAREFPRLPEVLLSAYPRYEAGPHPVGSPIPSTLLGLDTPEHAATIVVEADSGRAETGVVFLHGFGGNFALQCLEVARPLRASALTVCPSVGLSGAWWTRGGEATVRAAVALLRSRGVRTVILAGLSNGAAGASLLAPRLRGELDGVVLISGVGQAPTPQVPTLMLQGTADGMMSTRSVRAWVAAHPTPQLHYVELDGTHFLLLEQPSAVAATMRAFVERVSRSSPRLPGRGAEASGRSIPQRPARR